MRGSNYRLFNEPCSGATRPESPARGDPRSSSFSPYYQAGPNATVTNSLKGLRTLFVASRLSTGRNECECISSCFRRGRDVFCFRARVRLYVIWREKEGERYEERIIPDFVFRDWVSSAETQECRSDGESETDLSHGYNPRDIYSRGGSWSVLSTLCSIEAISCLMRFLWTIYVGGNERDKNHQLY